MGILFQILFCWVGGQGEKKSFIMKLQETPPDTKCTKLPAIQFGKQILHPQ